MHTWSRNCLISEQRCVAHIRVLLLLIPLLQSFYQKQPGLRLQQYKVLLGLLPFRLTVLMFASTGFALQAIPEVT
jgi:hypothetical protein